MPVRLLKRTEGSHEHGSVTWIFSFASGRYGLPRYGETCSWGWGWWSGRGTLSNGLPRDLTPLSRDTWAPYIPACSLCQNAHFLRYSFSNLLTPNSDSNPHPIRRSRPTSYELFEKQGMRKFRKGVCVWVSTCLLVITWRMCDNVIKLEFIKVTPQRVYWENSANTEVMLKTLSNFYTLNLSVLGFFQEQSIFFWNFFT